MEVKVIETGFPYKKKLAYPLWDQLDVSLNWIRKQGISIIGISRTYGWNDETDLNFLSKNSWIEGIAIIENGFDITPLNQLYRLKYINLSGNSYKGVVDLQPIKELVELRIGYNLQNFSNLEKTSILKVLELYNWPHETLQNLAKLELLEWVEIYKSPKLKSLNGIQCLKNLYYLKLYSVPKLVDIVAIGLIAPSLKKLSFENAKKVIGFEVLDKLLNIENFYINESAPIHSIQWIKNLKNLKYAYIGTEVLDGDVEFLKEKKIEYKKSKSYK